MLPTFAAAGLVLRYKCAFRGTRARPIFPSSPDPRARSAPQWLVIILWLGRRPTDSRLVVWFFFYNLHLVVSAANRRNGRS